MTKNNKGLTLTELLIAIAVLAILTGIAVPQFRTLMNGYRLNGAARQVMGDLMWARMQAVKQNNEFKIFFLNDHEYKILDDDDDDGTADGGEWTETKDIQDEYYDVTFSSNVNPIFDPRGTASAWGKIVTLTNSSGSKDVKVHITGRVKIE